MMQSLVSAVQVKWLTENTSNILVINEVTAAQLAHFTSLTKLFPTLVILTEIGFEKTTFIEWNNIEPRPLMGLSA